MKILFEADDAVFQFDEENHTFLFGWKGTVSYPSIRKAMLIAIDMAKDLDKVHWLIDRRNLEGYAGEARIWIKNEFILNQGKSMIAKIDKIAAIESESAMGKLSSNVLTAAIKKANPSIETKEFDYPQPASNWLAGITPQEPVQSKSRVRKLFSRKNKN